MSRDDLQGYRGPGAAVLNQHKVGVWSEVEIDSTAGRFTGLILPRSETADDRHIVLKLSSGYNVGVAAETITRIKETGRREAHYKIPEKEFPLDAGKPNVKLLGTGGTIASRLDYRTGAVIPAFSPGELYGSVPELADICNLSTEKLFGVFSENMARAQYVRLAERIGEEIAAGVDGIVIGHGTDTMHHTAAILTFMVQNPPIPIVIVGSQRSSDRPSSDAAPQPDVRGEGRGGGRHCRSDGLHVRPHLGRIRLAAQRLPRPQDALELPLDLSHDRRDSVGAD